MQMEKEVKLAEVKERERQQLEADKEVRLVQVAADEKRAQVKLQMKLSREEEAKNRREQEARRIKPSEASSQLPALVEENVNSYFRTFEIIAVQNEWPEEKWLSILVPKLVGKAYKV